MKGELWKQLWIGIWRGFTCWTLPIRKAVSSFRKKGCQHEWLVGRHPVTLELTTRTCLKCHKKQNYRAEWR